MSRGGRETVLEVVAEKVGGMTEDEVNGMELTAWMGRSSMSKSGVFFFLYIAIFRLN